MFTNPASEQLWFLLAFILSVVACFFVEPGEVRAVDWLCVYESLSHICIHALIAWMDRFCFVAVVRRC